MYSLDKRDSLLAFEKHHHRHGCFDDEKNGWNKRPCLTRIPGDSINSVISTLKREYRKFPTITVVYPDTASADYIVLSVINFV